jgi:hypothetical protein
MGALYHHERRLLARPGVLRFAQSDGVDLSGVDQVESHVQGGAKRHQETHRSEDFQQEGGTGEFEFVKKNRCEGPRFEKEKFDFFLCRKRCYFENSQN